MVTPYMQSANRLHFLGVMRKYYMRSLKFEGVVYV